MTWSLPVTIGGSTSFSGTHSYAVAAGTQQLLVYFLEMDVLNHGGPTEISLDDFTLTMEATETAVPVPRGTLGLVAKLGRHVSLIIRVHKLARRCVKKGFALYWLILIQRPS